MKTEGIGKSLQRLYHICFAAGGHHHACMLEGTITGRVIFTVYKVRTWELISVFHMTREDRINNSKMKGGRNLFIVNKK